MGNRVGQQKNSITKTRWEIRNGEYVSNDGETTNLLELLDGSLVDTTTLVDQMARGSGLATVDVCSTAS